ncbi:MAG: SAM-dependent methyltransferase [Nitrospirae bacterium]|nr:SAM-dependent methyltransferase [Nitrospirota bacterium]
MKNKIIERINSEGPISFETFMEMALYYPDLGYYTRESAKIGRTGDFYTSPHLHHIFGAMIGRQMEEMWVFMERPEIFHVVEMGAGMGYLASDMLEYLRNKELFGRIKYTIVELNQSMRANQKILLKEFPNKVGWVSDIEELETVSGCFFGQG